MAVSTKMHPFIAKFLDVSKVVEVLNRETGLDEDELQLIATANEHPSQRDSLRSYRAGSKPKAALEQQAIVLVSRAALEKARHSDDLQEVIAQTSTALDRQGFTPEQRDNALTQVLLEEAFGFPDQDSDFDLLFIQETLRTLQPLAALDQEAVDALIEEFAAQSKAGKPLRFKVAETLLSIAWNDGAEPINAEHLDEAIEQLENDLTAHDFLTALPELAALLGTLQKKRLLGDLRYKRLTHIVDSTRPDVGSDIDESESEEDDLD